ncbi:MAG: hypothetical protein Q9157_007029 [Trypethelium eluteriae]
MSSPLSEGLDGEQVTGMSIGGKAPHRWMIRDDREEEAILSYHTTGLDSDSEISCEPDQHRKMVIEGDEAGDDNNITASSTVADDRMEVAHNSEPVSGTQMTKRRKNKDNLMRAALSNYKELRRHCMPIVKAAAYKIVLTTHRVDFTPFFQNGFPVKTFFHAKVFDFGEDEECGAILYYEDQKVMLAQIFTTTSGYIDGILELMNTVSITTPPATSKPDYEHGWPHLIAALTRYFNEPPIEQGEMWILIYGLVDGNQAKPSFVVLET